MVEYMIFIFIMAIALAMDAFAVATTLGMDGAAKTARARFKIGLSFGFFQGLLFFSGYASLLFVSGNMTAYNHYIAGAILAFLGIRMIKEGFEEHENTCPHELCRQRKCNEVKCLKTGKTRKLTFKLLIFYGIATSIDALAAGITYGLIYESIVFATIAISGIAFVFSYIGATFGKKLGHLIGNKANLVGGLILIGLGLKALFF